MAWLPLYPKAKWTGSLRVLQKNPDGSTIVEFDAYDPFCKEFVYDRCTLTAKQLDAWTRTDESQVEQL